MFNSRPLPDGKIKDGSNFSRDARGNWFLNIAIEVAEVAARPIRTGVGIDLGLKAFATLSTGESIDNPRHLHKLSHRLVREFDYIAVGNVNASRLARTSMAKSVLDAGWSSFRNMLRYKAMAHGASVEEVDERLTSQTCSSCGALPDSRPKGIAGLGIREWICSGCDAVHDRDVNAALNILRLGHQAPVVGIPVRNGGEDVKQDSSKAQAQSG